jgi:hypothetical protein
LEGINLIERYKKNHVRWIATAPGELIKKRNLEASDESVLEEVEAGIDIYEQRI